MTARGSTQPLTVVFYDAPGGSVVNPTSVTLRITLNGTLVHGPITSGLTLDGPGHYSYDWAIPSDAVLGLYVIQWSGILPGDTTATLGYENVTVTEYTAPSVPDFGGCLWPIDPACLTDEWAALPEDVQNRSQALASAVLRRLTGFRVGGCPITVRPVPQRGFCFVPYTGGWDSSFRPGMNQAGNWVNNCGWGPETCQIVLPGPVGRIDEVLIDGAVVTPTDYRLDSGNILVWMGADPCPFPHEQDLSLATTEEGTMSVTYLNAYPVDSLGAYAVGVLAVEFSKACTGDKKCRLPAGVTQVTRQGLTMDIVSGSFPNGVTGIREVDYFIGLWNPAGRTQATTVWTPDQPQHRRVTL